MNAPIERNSPTRNMELTTSTTMCVHSDAAGVLELAVVAKRSLPID